jgi:hypothetical protein
MAEKDSDYRAEVSVEKISEEDARLKDDAYIRDLIDKNIVPEALRYGKRNTLRSDVYDYNREMRALCMPDIKTGKEPMSLARMHKLARGGLLQFPYANRFIIFTMWPTRMRPNK